MGTPAARSGSLAPVRPRRQQVRFTGRVTPRRRVDPARWPGAARYALALVIVAIVVWLVVALADDGSREPAGWYAVVVTAGAVVLLILVIGTIVRTVISWLRRR